VESKVTAYVFLKHQNGGKGRVILEITVAKAVLPSKKRIEGGYE